MSLNHWIAKYQRVNTDCQNLDSLRWPPPCSGLTAHPRVLGTKLGFPDVGGRGVVLRL